MRFIISTISMILLLAIVPSAPFASLVQDMPHGDEFDLNCSLCHIVKGWSELKSPLEFDHNTTSFPLEGRHVQVSCSYCHETLEFSSASTQCIDCHLDVHNDQFGISCDRCHDPDGWLNDTRFRTMHEETRFSLTGAHGGPDCAACHAEGRYVDIPLDCAGCHYDTYLETSNPDHAGAGFSTDCSLCHGQAEAAFEGNVVAFDHTDNFPLIQGHRVFDCALCHEPGSDYAETSTECISCHRADYEGTDDPDHVEAGFPEDCSICHTIDDWDDAEFDHSLSDFPLTGEHRDVDCNECHSEGYTGTPTECNACHDDDFDSAIDPPHDPVTFDTDCTLCHSTNGWSPAPGFSHEMVSTFEITGEHLSLDCSDCHLNAVYVDLGDECYDCHQEDYFDTDDPDHEAEAYPTDCTLCHDTFDWEGAEFDHDLSDFPLTGSHLEVECIDCHADGYDGIDTACVSCHQDEYDDATDPIHTLESFDLDCTLCHDTVEWEQSTFDHNVDTEYLVEGAHVELSCAECHADGLYAGTPNTCYGCHQADYEGVDDPDHVANDYSFDCLECHTQNDWDAEEGFPHEIITGFALVGGHSGLTCEDCHADGYAITEAICISCHQADFDSATDPAHEAESFGNDCEVCHTVEAWTPSSFDHDTQTLFILDGQHLTLTCVDCHADGQYVTTPETCFGCHEADYNDPDDPDHVADNFPTDCTICHNTSDWEDADYDHATTDFPLTGAHMSLNCADCHSDGYVGTPTECFACHEEDYNNVDDPDHVAENYPHDCTECHTTNDWDEVVFDHADTDFPLTGAHIELNCLDCHADGYAGTPTACFGCHEEDYNNVDDPDHVAENYSHDCLECHNTFDWEDVVIDHSLTDFPLEGAHQLLECVQCHADGYTGTPTVCFGCHEEDFDLAEPVHEPGAFGTECTDCHTQVVWIPSIFDHNEQTNYDLTGMHLEQDCTLCHVGGQYTGTPENCFFCHADDYNQANDPNHQAAAFPTDCEMCHNTFDWEDADFTHIVWFPIYNGSHQGEWDTCADCHPNSNDYTEFDCLSCHEQGETNEDHDEVPNYQYNSFACYDCHPDGEEGPGLFHPDLQDDPNRKEPH
jgi:hypothetical protein